MKHARSKACDIPPKVKQEVWERDGECCVICGSPYAMPNCHYKPRSAGGLGIPKNVVTACIKCHHEYDNGSKREEYGEKIREHLICCYPDWSEEEITYNKWEGFACQPYL